MILKLMIVRKDVDINKTKEEEEKEMQEYKHINSLWNSNIGSNQQKANMQFLIPKSTSRRYFQGIKIVKIKKEDKSSKNLQHE